MPPTKKVGKYEIAEQIGVGGFGVVYKAWDPYIQRWVALKVCNTREEEATQRFFREAQLAGALQHPNITLIYDFGIEDDTPFFVQEFLSGQDLDGLLQRGKLTLDACLGVLSQVCAGLEFAHSRGIIHRDIKPANVMLTSEGQVMLTDFGLAAMLGQQFPTDGRTTSGTPEYMSPEQIHGQPCDERSDVYSLGVVLYEMVSGRLPFQAESLVALALTVHDSEPQPLAALRSGVPAELERLVARMLAKKPEERYQQASELVLDLAKVREGLAGSRIPEPVTKRPGRYLARRRWRYTASAVAAVVLVAIVGVFLTLRWRREVQAPPPRLAPLTSTVGLERTPAISPDGRQVAFGWNGEREDNFDIYVQPVEGGAPLRLTTHPGAESSPVWSPDGRFIAFYRGGSEPGAYLVAALGRPERKLADNAIPDCFTTDGRGLVVEHQGALQLMDLASGGLRQITSAPRNAADAYGALSPDGRWLAFVRGNRSGQFQDLLRIPFPPERNQERQPVRLTHDIAAIVGLDWTANGKEIVFASARQGMQALWRVSAFSAGAPQRLEAAGEDAVWPSISRAGNRLVYLHDYQDRDIWRLSVPRRGSRILWEELNLNGATPLIASTRADQMAEYSPDGTRIAFTSARSGALEIWVCDAEGRGARMVTSFRGPPAWWPRWSPDGKQLAFYGRSEGRESAYIVPAEGGTPRVLVTHAVWPSWSRNGRWVYYYSDRSGRHEIWKSLADGTGEPVQVTLNGGYAARESPDGKFLYYLKPGAELWRLPTAGGPEVRVLEGSGLASMWPAAPSMNWAPLDQGVLLADGAKRVLRFFPVFAEGQAGSPEIPGIASWAGLSLSPDGRWLLVSRSSRATVDVMLIDNFR